MRQLLPATLLSSLLIPRHRFVADLVEKGSRMAGRVANEEVHVSCNRRTLMSVMDSLPESLSAAVVLDASSGIDRLLMLQPSSEEAEQAPMSSPQLMLTDRALLASTHLCKIAGEGNSKRTWNALQSASSSMLTQNEQVSATLAATAVTAALALEETHADRSIPQSKRAAASAIAASISRWKQENGEKSSSEEAIQVARSILHSLLQLHSKGTTLVDLNIVTHLARSFRLNSQKGGGQMLEQIAGSAIQKALRLVDGDNSRSTLNAVGFAQEKQQVADALTLAAQMTPYNVVSPVMLVQNAVLFSLWHAAEGICESAADSPEAFESVYALIDAAFEAKRYRQADNFATRFFNQGGASRYLEARYLHACGTIGDVVRKGALPLVERQVERVDRAVEKVSGDIVDSTFADDAATEIRRFAIHRLEEMGHIDTAHRLAAIWGIECIFDEETVLKAAAARRKRYLQWEDALRGCVPDLISSPKELILSFEKLRETPYTGPFGFDSEWDEGGGVAVLQIASTTAVVLIDILELVKSKEGVDALEKTVGQLFDDDKAVVVGFSCRQDLSKLRATPTASDGPHWLTGTSRAVVDAQNFVAEDQPHLKGLGLSRVAQHYLGKPLDKAEQCSMWSKRPLTIEQRIYASLDAWVCAAIYEKVFPNFAGDES